jgi:L-lactate dehydrogenase (cytochrome)
MDLDQRFPAVSDLRARARRRVPHFVFEYLDSATGFEDQHRRNMEALRAVRFEPSILEGAFAPDLSTTFLGRRYPLPFGCAPVGMAGIMWPGAEKILAAACAGAGIPYCMSTVATVVPETLAPHIGDQGWFQLYMPKDKGIRSDMMARAKAAGFHTLILTVDVPVDSRRERQRRANLRIPPKVDAADALVDAAASRMDAGHAARGHPEPQVLRGLCGPQGRVQLDRPCGPHHPWPAGLVGRRRDPGRVGRALRREGRDEGRRTRGGWWPPGSMRSGCRTTRAASSTGPGLRPRAAADAGGAAGHAAHLRQRRDGGLDILRAIALGADFVMLGRAFHYAVGALAEKAGRRISSTS